MLREDIMRMFEDFYQTGKFVRNMNLTFIIMIPKKGGADDFRILG